MESCDVRRRPYDWDYRRWKQPERYDFSFCKYPFVYDPASKARILQLAWGGGPSRWSPLLSFLQLHLSTISWDNVSSFNLKP